MRLIFIRHGDPDYIHDSLTEKGRREAALLAERVATWKVDEFYCSPLGRAQETARYSLEKLNRTAQTFEWLKEFYITIKDPETGKDRIPWDFMPDFWTKDPLFYDKDNWTEAEVLKTGDLRKNYDEVAAGLDSILAKHGYIRNGAVYKTNHTQPTGSGIAAQDGKTLVFFCHLGVSFVMMAHLLGFSPAQLFHNFFVAPTSVTVLNAEERIAGTAMFRTQVIGCTRHLAGLEPISASGYFTDAFQG